MNIKQIIMRIFGRHISNVEAEMNFLIKNGLTLGSNVQNYSLYAFDSEYPWLITVGDNCIIGAGSVVSKDIPSNSVAAGNPAKVICSIDDFKSRHAKFLEEKPVFEKPWYEWPTATKEEKMEMKRKLQGTFGYIK